MLKIPSRLINNLSLVLQLSKEIRLDNSSEYIPESDVLFFCHDVNRGVKLNGMAYSPLMDSLRDQCEKQGLKCVTIANPWSKLIGVKAYGSPISINKQYFIAKALSKIYKKLLISKNYNPEAELYENIILKSKPKLIITMNSNSALCQAARALNVYQAELLHGIGYTPIPWGWDTKKKSHLPQCILSLDSVSTKTFSQLKKHNIDIKEISHPFLQRFTSNEINNLPREWLPPAPVKNFKKEIVVSLQWGYSPGIDEKEILKNTLPNGLFYPSLETVIKQTQDTIFWRFRLHPVQYTQPEKYFKQIDTLNKLTENYKNCEWKKSSSVPLPSLLIRCSGHITMSSMSSYEAAYQGVPTLALEPLLRKDNIYSNMFEDLVSSGYLTKSEATIDNILEWIEGASKISPLLSSLKNNKSNHDTINWLIDRANGNSV